MAHVTVFGANGRIGSRVVQLLADQGHSVNACVYGKHALPDKQSINVVTCNVYKYDDVATALSGSQIVISALGSWGTPKKDILTEGMKNIIPAMKASGISRIVSLTGADARDADDKPDIIHKLSHAFFGIIAGKILQDGEAHLRLLRESSLDWTVVRSPVMKDTGSPSYTLTAKLPSPFASIHRDAVAKCLVDLALNSEYKHQAPIITQA